MSDDRPIIKYPRTPHIEGSRLQAGDEDMSQTPFAEFANRRVVVEEKIDGANTAVSFGLNGELLLQSRGHYLSGGYRERHYDLFKQWAGAHSQRLRSALGSRYIMYGEWTYAKHTVFYDSLPHYFMEFDILDRETGEYLDTKSRRDILRNLPVCSAAVLFEGVLSRKENLLSLLGDSNYISPRHIERLRAEALKGGLDADKIVRETDSTATMEGLYVKAESDGKVVARAKFVRRSFLQTVEMSESHWLDRPIVPNLLSRPISELFDAELKRD